MSPPKDARVLIVGSGGREHALGAALKASPYVASLAYCGGPNAGLEAIAERLADSALEDGAFDLVVIGPEAPLADGLADRLRARGLTVFGPSAAAARLEASKAFAKAVCARANVPTAAAQVCESEAEAMAAVRQMGAPVVVKADGLAAGKGVTVAATLAEAEAAVTQAFAGAFGAAGARLLIEEKLEGPEVSLFALSDGQTVVPLATARDYKRAYDGDRGPNTGGMGAISPAPGVGGELVEEAMDSIVRPALAALAAVGTPYTGVIYAGLMLTAQGPKLIEFNVRFGDPECQAILPRLLADPFELLYATATGCLARCVPKISEACSLCVVVAAQGYPGEVERGEPIEGFRAMGEAGAMIFHAGTRREGPRVVSNGGRVLNVVALGESCDAARRQAYAALELMVWPGGRFRSDIAL